ncbi:MOSC domain-containing protein [Cereibacter sphaeroides]|uniref:MOSC domain-containing protein n=1 Tax=Cereibacter sphaeroides TaxID=1063 RepID=UPI001F20CA7B|nr:MOSC domain-containing protein [Cereibacter sphaeroides]MCE6951157.1 MOSC domain-containing protein [Cereibacter sphaeroides]MCE6958635.1 MOSC domain-containing protein [Cereibacter sphaeroides]MCE6968932.1 MOSC domain-containing protein [Cereibacter sphaeroides]MCE6971268.1 MOSC domain-containing protein [Cereibacter sphaeroides]
MTARLGHICRHPIKAHGREELASVLLSPGACLPWDRHWAIAHESAKLEPGWSPCHNFSRGAKAPALMAITATFDESSRAVSLAHPDLSPITVRPDVAEEAERLVDWVRPLVPADRARPCRVVTAGRGMTDSAFPSVAILSLSSLSDLSERMGQPMSIHRWRGNLWVDGWAPWAEFGLIGQEIRIGSALLRIEERITRCRATSADPDTGRIDADTLGALERHYGHRDFGVYATVVEGGRIAIGEEVRT